MNKLLLISLCSLTMLWAMASAPALANPAVVEDKIVLGQDTVVDTFDDADIATAPNWWTFDRIQVTFPKAQDKAKGLYSLKVTGKAESYYVGGMGAYLAKDITQADTMVMDIYGIGPATGTIKIQMFDDDNGNYQVEQDSKYEPIYDDRVEYELPVTWSGWKTVEIPLAKFVDTNPGIGDDIFNPEAKNGSGGLLQIQLVFTAASATGNVNMMLDNIYFTKKSQ